MTVPAYVTAVVLSLSFISGQCMVTPSSNYSNNAEVCMKVPYSFDQCIKEALVSYNSFIPFKMFSSCVK